LKVGEGVLLELISNFDAYLGVMLELVCKEDQTYLFLCIGVCPAYIEEGHVVG